MKTMQKIDIAKNQYLFKYGNNIFFHSYNSCIYVINFKTKTIHIGKNWGCSKTTSKYTKHLVDEELYNAIDEHLKRAGRTNFSCDTCFQSNFKVIFNDF